MIKKRQSRRISSRKRHNIEKKIKQRSKKIQKKMRKIKKDILPKNVRMSDEDLEELKRIKEMEKSRPPVVEEEVDYLWKTLVEENDVLVEVLDPRDPVGSRNPSHEEYVKAKGKDLVIYVMGSEMNLPNVNRKIGIFGQKGVGKMTLYKRLSKDYTVDKTLYRTECKDFSLLSLFRNVIPLESLFYKRLFEEFFKGREDLYAYFKGDVKAFLREIHTGRIKFWRESDKIEIQF